VQNMASTSQNAAGNHLIIDRSIHDFSDQIYVSTVSLVLPWCFPSPLLERYHHGFSVVGSLDLEHRRGRRQDKSAVVVIWVIE
jgi:hypothetical protein